MRYVTDENKKLMSYVKKLWDQKGEVPAKRIREFKSADELRLYLGNGKDRDEKSLRQLMYANPVRFVMVSMASPIVWIDPNESYEFWLSVCDNIYDKTDENWIHQRDQRNYEPYLWSGKERIVSLEHWD